MNALKSFSSHNILIYSNTCMCNNFKINCVYYTFIIHTRTRKNTYKYSQKEVIFNKIVSKTQKLGFYLL